MGAGEQARGWSPVRRFSIALALVLAVTAATLALGTAGLVGRFVEDETARFTEEAVASHFATVFNTDVFQRTLSEQERARLQSFVVYHFSIYDVVATQFFTPDGTIVLSYDPSEVGRRIDPARERGLAVALAGGMTAERVTTVGDRRFGDPAQSGPAMVEHGMVPGTAAAAAVRREEVEALRVWVSIREDGELVGAVVVWRDLAPIDAALRRIQATLAGIIGAAAALLWLVLRGVYVRSSRQILAQSRALTASLAETERAYDATLRALSNALDVRDSETEGHSLRVVEYLDLIARELGLASADLVTLRRGALLHDVGKIGVPDHILRKPTPLTEHEWATMRRHPDHGARIIAEIPFLGEVATIVRHHHERWDGRGYPAGLAGEAIPFGARLFTVADAFDAMTSDRPYRRAMSIADARAEVERARGTQFDPRVADAFLRVPVERLAAVGAASAHDHMDAAAS